MNKDRFKYSKVPVEPSFSHYKDKCVCCEETGKLMNKEHVFPKWLLRMTNCEKELLKSIYGYVSGDKLTVPLCEECNSRLGNEIENPTSKIFKNIVDGNGFNDFEAELLIRWLWKIKGLFYWSICNEDWKYSYITLEDKVLRSIESPRSRLSIGVALISDEFENNEYGYAPIGMDAFTLWSNVYIAGVFSKLSIVVFYSDLKRYINEDIWTIYRLSDYPLLMNPNKRVLPRTVFKTGSKAIHVTESLLGNESEALKMHEIFALEQKLKLRSIKNP